MTTAAPKLQTTMVQVFLTTTTVKNPSTTTFAPVTSIAPELPSSSTLMSSLLPDTTSRENLKTTKSITSRPKTTFRSQTGKTFHGRLKSSLSTGKMRICISLKLLF